MENELKLLSLCIPTNGIIEWVFPVLDSIYSSGDVSEEVFEVIVTDNGNNKLFESKMQDYMTNHNNLIYKRTNAKQFLNQIEAFNLATGQLIKFINHRMKLLPDSLKYLVQFVKINQIEKPQVYFLNNSIKLKTQKMTFDKFDDFIRNLSFYSSWSGGIAIWKSDYQKLDSNIKYNELFPHTDLLFNSIEKNRKYIIDNSYLLKSLPEETSKKGNYNLFYAFAVEYMSILLNLVRDKKISLESFLNIKRDTKNFIASQYLEFIILKKRSSYDLSNYKRSLNVYFNNNSIRMVALKVLILRIKNKIFTNGE